MEKENLVYSVYENFWYFNSHKIGVKIVNVVVIFLCPILSLLHAYDETVPLLLGFHMSDNFTIFL